MLKKSKKKWEQKEEKMRKRISLQDYKIPYKFEKKKLIITVNFISN